MVTANQLISKRLNNVKQFIVFIIGIAIIISLNKLIILLELPRSLISILFWVILACIPFLDRPVVFGLLFFKSMFSILTILSSPHPNPNGLYANCYNLVGTIVFAEVMYRTIKGLRDLNNQLTEESEKANAASKAKANFLANMSHEIRTPISGIRGISEMMCEVENRSSTDKEHLAMIKSSSDILLHVVNDILNFSRIESGKESISPEICDSADLFKQVIEPIKSNYLHSSVELKLEVSPSLPKIIECDKTKIAQILTNLISNAMKFTDQGEVIVYATIENDATLQISVTDTGIGIKESDQALIFSEFERVHTSYEKSREGTGLGLAITKRLVEQLNGTLSVKSTFGSGSTFTALIPVVPMDEAADMNLHFENKVLEEKVAPCSINNCVLLAEDNKVNQVYIKHFLEKNGYDITIVENGVEAVSHFSENDYSAILMDIQMPLKSGVQATEEIRDLEIEKSLQKTPILALTASVTEEEQRTFLKAGMNEVIPKPIDIELLMNSLTHHINN